MSIDLGFESFRTSPSYGTLDSLLQFNTLASDLIDACHELNGAIRAYESVASINDCIAQYGVTRSLEALYGENFSSTSTMYQESMEAEKGLWQKIKDFFKKIWDRLVAFWNWLFNKEKYAINKLNATTYIGPFKFKVPQYLKELVVRYDKVETKDDKGKTEETKEAVNALAAFQLDKKDIIEIRSASDFDKLRKAIITAHKVSSKGLERLKTRLQKLKSRSDEGALTELQDTNVKIATTTATLRALVNFMIHVASAAESAKPEKEKKEKAEKTSQPKQQEGGNKAYLYW